LRQIIGCAGNLEVRLSRAYGRFALDDNLSAEFNPRNLKL